MPGTVGPALKMLLEDAPIDRVRAVLRDRNEAEEPDPGLVDATEALGEEEARESLWDAFDQQHPELLQPIEDRCLRIWQLADEKGPVSLRTVAGQRLYHDEWETFEEEPDVLCRSIWIWLHHRQVFEAAESFHNARLHRNYGRLYDAFEVDLDAPVATTSNEIDTTKLEEGVRAALDLRTACKVTAITLPATGTHPASVMLIIRAGGLQTSVSDFGQGGTRRTLYYRPPNEATLIWTPSQRLMEICSDSPPQREKIGSTFAQVVLDHDISRKPITWRRYDLSRFRESFFLPLPTLADCAITQAKVVEAEIRLGSWSRKLALKVALDDDITDVADKYLGSRNLFRRSAAFARIVIAVRYHRDGDDKERTLNLSVSSGNRSNVQSNRDPAMRSLGHALLSEWGILKPFRYLDSDEARRSLPILMQLYDYPDEDLTWDYLRDLGADPDRLMDAGLIERSKRQDIVLIDDDDEVMEATITPSRTQGQSSAEGTFGEDLGTRPTNWAERYRIRKPWLDQSARDAIRDLADAQLVQELDPDLTMLGSIVIDGSSVPIYLARRLYDAKALRRLDSCLRQRQSAGLGIVLSASEDPPVCLGPNVVVTVRAMIDEQDGSLSREALVLAFKSGRFLAAGGDRPQLLEGKGQSATLFVPGTLPYHVTGANQITIFRRLLKAYDDRSGPLAANILCEGMSYSSPSQAFRDWKELEGVYVQRVGARGGWVLAV